MEVSIRAGETSGLHAERVTFSREIREFVETSRQYQSLYANTDGSYKRTANVHDLSALERFIYLTISNSKVTDHLTPAERIDFDKDTKLLLAKICDLAKKWGTKQIHFTVVWVYYFDYDKSEMKSTPIFKIFKSKNDSLARYLDTNLVDYESWDDLINYAFFPKSFICFPRRGEYIFQEYNGEDLLDLEFVSKYSFSTVNRLRNSQPYSQTVVSPWLKHKKDMAPYVVGLRLISEALGLFQFYFVEFSSPVHVIIFLCATGFKILERWLQKSISESSIVSDVSDYSLMLLNDHEDSNSWSVSQRGCNPGNEKTLRSVSLVHLVEILRNPKDHLVDVLSLTSHMVECTCPLIRKLFLAVGMSSYSAEIWVQIIKFLSNLLRLPAFKDLIGITSEKLHDGLHRLMRNSAGKALPELKSTGEGGMEEVALKVVRNLTHYIPDNFQCLGYRIYVLSDASVPRCENFVLDLLKSEFRLRNRELFHEIIVGENVIGGFTFLTDSIALIAVDAALLGTKSIKFSKIVTEG